MAEQGDVAKKIQEKRTRVQQKAAVHAKQSKDRADEISNIKAAYQAERDGPVITDILKKAKAFASYHVKVAQDGVGARKTGYKLENGQDEVENIYFTAEQRVGHLDKASGLQELIDYIERQVKVEVPPVNPDLKQEVDNAQAEAADQTPPEAA